MYPFLPKKRKDKLRYEFFASTTHIFHKKIFVLSSDWCSQGKLNQSEVLNQSWLYCWLSLHKVSYKHHLVYTYPFMTGLMPRHFDNVQRIIVFLEVLNVGDQRPHLDTHTLSLVLANCQYLIEVNFGSHNQCLFRRRNAAVLSRQGHIALS